MSTTTPSAGTEPGASRVPPVTPAALEQEVGRLLRRYAGRDERVLLVRAQAPESALGHHTIDGRDVRIATATSPLHLMEQVTAHAETDDTLVLLTDTDERDLGPALLSHAIRQRIFPVDPWRLIEESFGAQRLDPRLTSDTWAGEALLDAMPPGGWPRLAGPLLTRDTALRSLADRRLRLSRVGIRPEDLDAAALLRWSREPELVDEFRALRDPERAGLAEWLRDCAGDTVEVLFALVEAGNASDAAALGLVCAALWHPAAGSDNAAQRAQGGVLTYLTMGQPGQSPVSDQSVREFGAAAEQLVTAMLDDQDETERRHAHTILDLGETLLTRFGAHGAARHSLLLRSSLDARVDGVAATLTAAVAGTGTIDDLAVAVAALREHALAGTRAHQVRRAEMAQRLVQWLHEGEPTARVTGVGAAVQAQIAEWGWVDRACADVWAGEQLNPTLRAAYRDLYQRVHELRRDLDKQFAGALASATSDLGDTLTVETVLPRAVAPVVTAPGGRRRPALLLVLDGMSADVAINLAEELRAERWEEYDPLDTPGDPRRRAAVAALPTVTQVSRASLLAARITTGGQTAEATEFAGHAFWKNRPASLFHKSAVSGGAGTSLGDDLARALANETTTVAVVLNTIDDSLDKGRSADAPWRIADITGLRALLDHARYQGRAVFLTSDHGHVLHRDNESRDTGDATAARYRTPPPPAGNGEVELSGPRVAADNGRVVALWDADLRYTGKKGGYHGGAALAEVAVPLLAFLPMGGTAPPGWRALPDQRPPWWKLERRPAPTARPVPAVPERRPRRPSAEPAPGQAALDLGEQQSSIMEALLNSELFQERHRGTPRKVPLERIGTAVTALVDAGGVLPLTVLAERIHERPVRASGFAATLGQILNVDNYPVLQIVDGGRNVRLDVELLRQQFELTKG